ncbi:vasorin isoform X2 [Seriola dumerili]|uniref:Vasorin b n=2 Tax=Seriola dumerili TaxID=41447 RepID=A0A3B4U9U8_SERDU|nr:vasorin isoform X2 [Seriola dumerili]
MERERVCTMKVFLTPLMPFLLLLIFPDGILSSACPNDCTCSTPESILCFLRRSSTIPKGVPSYTKSLYLFANGIEGLTAEDFDGMENLEMLDLSQNKLTELPDRVFEPLTSLRNLDLSSNQITHISEECFQGMALLERLYLYSNLIKTIHPAAFNGLGHLLELKIQGNQLTSLPALSMPRLLLLDLRFNVLPTLGPSDLQTPNLESLKLGGVGLTSLNKELIGSLKNLHELDISGNQLESFPSVLKETKGLIHLSLAGNPMGPLKVQDLQNLGELQDLDISSLSLQGLPEEFSQLFPHLRKLTVAENPFNCLCTLAWFPRWLRAQSIILERTEETRCHFPPINAGKVLERLEHRDFGCPTTTTITTSTVKTTTTLPVPVTTLPSTTEAIPAPRASDNPTDKDDDSPLLPVPASPSSSSSIDLGEDQHFCPSHTCLNGGTCRLDQHGQVECTCPHGTSGTYCEVQNHHPPSPPEAAIPMATVTADATDISSHEVTATSILVDLHRYTEMRPYIRGIRLTYRNLSGPDRRPIQLSLPASFPEYRLRGLKPNSTYTVCVSPLGAPSDIDSVCTEAHTAPESISGPDARVTDPRLTTMLAPAVAILLVLVLIAIAVGVVCYLRRKRAKGHLDLDCEPSQLELDGVKAGLDNGALPQKQPQIMIPEPAVQNGNLEYEVLLLQDHCTSNNNMSSHKPSYF